jgi:hypothetical protein
MNRTRVLSLTLSLFFSVGASLFAAPPNETAGGVELRRGVVVDEAAGTAYFAAANGTVEAVDVSSGRSLWSSADAALPIALVGRYLVAQAENVEPASRLRVVVFDVQAGNRKVVEAAIALPDEVYPLVADDLMRSFRATAERDADGLLVSWTYRESRVEGMAPPRGERVPERVVSGAAHVDLATGRTIAVPIRRIAADAMAEQVAQVNGLTRAPWRSGTLLAATEGGRGGPLTLKRWDARTGAALPERELSKKGLVALASADRDHVLAAERVGAGGPQDPEYRWSIFSVDSGDFVGELRRDISASPFVVWNGTLVFETPRIGYRTGETWVDEPLKIRGLRLSNGVPLWDHEIRDLSYQGTTPPRRQR